MLWSCATKKPEHKDGGDLEANNVPTWVYAPNEVCNEAAFLCASGQGNSIEVADLSAKKSLASIFETNIKSNFQIHTNSFTSERRSELTEKVLSEVEESLDLVLQAVEIKKRFQKSEVYYSLVSLNKIKARKALTQQIKDIDAQMDHLYREQARINITKLLLLLDKRQLLNERLIIIASNGISTDYTYSKITDLKYKKELSRVKIEYNESFPRSIRKWFESKLNNSGFDIVETNYDYKITMKLSTKEEYLNVQGFQKFTFVTQGSAKNISGEQVGSLEATMTETGRNENDAFLKIKENLQTKIGEKIDDLNIK